MNKLTACSTFWMKFLIGPLPTSKVRAALSFSMILTLTLIRSRRFPLKAMRQGRELDKFSLDFIAFLFYNQENLFSTDKGAKMTEEDQQKSNLPVGLAAPAQRALAAAGITRLEQLASFSEAELLKLHGMGPKALALLRQTLAAKGLSYIDKK